MPTTPYTLRPDQERAFWYFVETHNMSTLQGAWPLVSQCTKQLQTLPNARATWPLAVQAIRRLEKTVQAAQPIRFRQRPIPALGG